MLLCGIKYKIVFSETDLQKMKPCLKAEWCITWVIHILHWPCGSNKNGTFNIYGSEQCDALCFVQKVQDDAEQEYNLETDVIYSECFIWVNNQFTPWNAMCSIIKCAVQFYEMLK